MVRRKCEMENMEKLNLRKLQYFKFNSALLRNILSLRFRKDHFYRIPFGAISGSKLYYRKDINFHAMMGVWEKESPCAEQSDLSVWAEPAGQGNCRCWCKYWLLFNIFSKYLDPSAQILRLSLRWKFYRCSERTW